MGGLPTGRSGAQALEHLGALLRLGARGLLDRAACESEKARAKGFSIVTLEDDCYPALLREIADPPPVIYIGGRLEPDDEVRLALVGSRRASRYGLDIAETLGRRLARRGVTVVSGLARGIDAAAHRGALSGGTRTIAVLGSGLDRIYPPENRGLSRRIMEGGAVISEFPLDLPPLPRFFPRRNRVISGLCAGVVVVEAAFASGALVTARLALEQCRELYAVPGSILSPSSAGTDDLLASSSAHLVTCAEAILDELPAAFRVRLGLPPSPPIGGSSWRRRPGGVPFIDEDAEIEAAGTDRATGLDLPAAAFGPDTDLVARHLTREDSVSVDELAALCRLPVPRLLAALSALELRGIAVALPGNRVARSGR